MAAKVLDQTMVALRKAALTEFAEKARTSGEFAGERALGVMMETGYDETTVSLVTWLDGTASLYFSTGGGVIGGQGDAATRIFAKRFTQFAGTYLHEMKACSEYPTPRNGETIFYVMAAEGVFTLGAKEEELGELRHAFSPLFHSGHAVITHLRMASDKHKQGGGAGAQREAVGEKKGAGGGLINWLWGWFK